MAAGKLPKPGSGDGPCAEECAHTDCRLTKRWAQERCLHCGEAIGYETRFYRTEEVFAHAVCLELVAEADREGCGAEMRTRLRREGRLVVSRPRSQSR